ncbi:MAG: TonB-dependent receptor, partial [Myxococcales bacterium]|nr:TonB-dependent receptor [Myxococcales bacterium]
SALASRMLFGLFGEHQSAEGASGDLGFWLGHDSFRAQQNFTGFLQRSRTLERVAGRGDLIEQDNETLSFGLSGRFRTAPYRPHPWLHGRLELGLEGRLDLTDQSQSLLDASVRNQTWDRRVDASIRGMDLGAWGDLEARLTRRLQARLGLRADILSYAIDDRLGNFAPASRPADSFLIGFRRSALGLAWGPRASLRFALLETLSLLAAYGEGYRSPQARTLEDGEDAPFSKVRSADLGARLELSPILHLSVGGYATFLSDDVAFDAAEGRLERIGATRRIGAVAHALSRPTDWLLASLSLTYVRATVEEPPPATAEEPQPPFERGQSVPFVPPLVVRADLGLRHAIWRQLGGAALEARAGLGFSFLSSRPLPYGEYADPLALLDATLGLGWGPLELGLELFNALDARYAAVEYDFPSSWDPEGPRSRLPTRHIAAGAPLSWTLHLGLNL